MDVCVCDSVELMTTEMCDGCVCVTADSVELMTTEMCD